MRPQRHIIVGPERREHGTEHRPGSAPASEATTSLLPACLSFADIYAQVGPESTGFDNWTDGQEIATALGSTTTFPDLPLSITAPGEESGTFDSFVELVLEARPKPAPSPRISGRPAPTTPAAPTTIPSSVA